ncbi:hypothetical protein JCM15457_1375 [Liquorilactobacillus sucicola DSM 21376 = JCM 15457]|uniref:Uncharacterized protein n=1 Tax=Liquorilactobacillus sucicola DSM 21376 = JCM 15457 TaxID=1423806 RepID=A0A023CX54_9LACO|nr:hypothetical protein FD15_GL000528 [Liquorilactobacillus sucicola DSM 21376 = JCM 15457]GAJ26447.1 hypothetical protein JCM15457_1375 [Liquorilactobacillus sucicola DSM 21376 = JCM 15457]
MPTPPKFLVLLNRYSVTAFFTIIAIIDLFLSREPLTARFLFLAWNFGTALLNEKLLFHFFYASSSSSRYAKLKAVLCLWQVVLAVLGFYLVRL